jgi:Tol biopolymer transport system component
VDAAGGEWDRMTELTDRVQLAAWSPDGRQLVYTLQGDENLPPRVVTVADAPAWAQRPWPSTTDVVEWQGDVYGLVSIDWSPTDELVVEGLPDERAGPNRIFAVSPDGSAVRLVTEPAPNIQRGTVMDRKPSVSPDGDTIIFYSGSGPGTTSVWAAGTDGTGRIEVTDQIEPYIGSLSEQAATGASWSPDGARLVLGARTGPLGPADIWTMRAQGTDLRRLNQDVHIDRRPSGLVARRAVDRLDQNGEWAARDLGHDRRRGRRAAAPRGRRGRGPRLGGLGA